MKIKFLQYKYSIFLFVLLCLSSNLSYAEKLNEKLEFSGFARVVLGYLDESDATYLGYDNNLSFSEQSLIALQADYKISSQLSATAQVIGISGDERESGIEWLYLTYEPNRFTQIKVGRQRTPFFNYSDVIDVGFVYPWITLPQQVYSSVYFSTFDGILAGYERSVGDFLLGFEAFWGSFNGDIISAGVTVPSNVNDTQGLIFNINYDSLTFRAAYHRADIFFEIRELLDFSTILSQSGFTESAASLNPNGKVEFYQLGTTYEKFDYFVSAEYTKITGESSVVPTIDSFYLVAGYNYRSYTTYASYGKTNSSTGSPVNEIPLGLSDDLDFLAASYNFTFSQLAFNTSESITIGTRWNWKTNLALKAEVTWTRTASDSTANFERLNDNFDNQAPLYQLALEWVF